MAALLAVHGLATPGMILGQNGDRSNRRGGNAARWRGGHDARRIAAVRRTEGDLARTRRRGIKLHPERGRELLNELGGFDVSAWPQEDALALLRDEADIAFDSRCIDALERTVTVERSNLVSTPSRNLRTSPSLLHGGSATS
jgi:hypothetical protein